MGLTTDERRALWLVYFAMRMRFDGNRPASPTKAQWAEIAAADQDRPPNSVYAGLMNRGLLTGAPLLRLTAEGFAALGVEP